MKDGNMGSLYFISNVNPNKRFMGKCIAEKEFKDLDNVPILVSLNIDTKNCLYELDIWKVDFSPVIKHPTG